MKPIVPCLWFDTQAEEAALFYVSIFPSSKITAIERYVDDMPMPAGTVLIVQFELNGQPFTALNGGPGFPHTQAVSLMVPCETQQDIDSYAEKLTAGGGQLVRCGWVTDRFGLSWQILPFEFFDLMGRGSQRQKQALMDALRTMITFDIAALRRAYDGA